MKATKLQAYAFLRKHSAKLAAAAVAVVALSLLLGTSITAMAAIIGLIAVAAFSTFYFNYVSLPINFELVKLSTILVAYTQGIAAGLVVGVLSTIIGKVLIGRIDERLPISVAAISAVAVLAGLFSGADITVLGTGLAALYSASMFAISMMLGGDLGWNLPYEGSSFLINFVLFTRIAPLILPLLQ